MHTISQLLLPIASVLSAVHAAAPSALTRCSTDENCDDERVTVWCSNVTSYSPCILNSACYCHSGNAYRCADLCQLSNQDDGDSCTTVCSAYHRCTSGETVTAIELAAVESPASGSSKSSTYVPTEAWYFTLLGLVPIAVVVGIFLNQRKKRIVEPTQESHTTTAIELREVPSGIVSRGGGDDNDPDSEVLVTDEM